MDVLVTYDIATITREGERRLLRIAGVCERYGVRVQYSVFECRLSPASLEHFMGELMDVLEPKEDSINVYRFDRTIEESRTSLGRAKEAVKLSWIIKAEPRDSGDP